MIITRKCEDIVATAPYPDYYISDHVTIICDLTFNKPSNRRKEIKYRNIKNINIEEFRKDIKDKLTVPSDCLTDSVRQYNQCMLELLDKHAPEKCKVITIRENSQWYNEDILTGKQTRRKLEKNWRENKTPDLHRSFQDQKVKVNEMMNDAKTSYYSGEILGRANDQAFLFRMMNNWMNKKQGTPLPDHSDLKSLANEFVSFFINKITTIRVNLEATQYRRISLDIKDKQCDMTLSTFSQVSEDYIMGVIGKSPSKSCELDPIPAQLLNQCLPELIPHIAHIINLSLAQGIFPEPFKEAIVRPLLKKPNLDLIMKNYRPVSNLQFISKVCEKVVAAQLMQHVEDNHLLEVLQSAYRPGHSTESALLRVQNDILMAMDQQQVVVLILLDLSAAFDTIDHEVLLNRLRLRCGIDGVVLDWIASYLQGRYQEVSVDGVHSDKVQIKYGVPQGSVLGPILFSIYMTPLGDILRAHNSKFHQYADDQQLYTAFKPTEANLISTVANVNRCLADVTSWMIQNFLQFNGDKTEILICGTRQQLAKITVDTIQLGDSTISVTQSARNLGVIFDSNMNMNAHITKLCQIGHMHLRNIVSVRKYLTQDAAESLVHAFVTSRLDCCNSLLYNTSGIKKLQSLQNSAARVITGTRKYEHITPVLKQLHWLKIPFRIEFKLCVFMYKVLHGQAPQYLCELISIKMPTRSLRSNSRSLVSVPRTKNVTCGDRAFSVVGPRLWNSLPQHVQDCDKLDAFKKFLKTYLFKKCFEL